MSNALILPFSQVQGVMFVKLLEPTESFRYYRLLIRMIDGREVRIAFGAHWVDEAQSDGAYQWMGESMVKVLYKALECGDTDVPPNYGMTGMDTLLYLRSGCNKRGLPGPFQED